jgi:Domain of unknown function (DUF397)
VAAEELADAASHRFYREELEAAIVNESGQKSSLSHMNGNCVEVRWQKSSLSGNQGNCVDVASSEDGAVLMRNSRDSLGPVLIFTVAEWDAFIGGAKLGEFDLDADGKLAPREVIPGLSPSL